MMFNKLIISPPFGNIISWEFATSVVGTFTLMERKGLYSQYLKTFRPVYKNSQIGWRNSIGLRNPGMEKLKTEKLESKILSIAALKHDDYYQIADHLINLKLNKGLSVSALELNISCPNAKVLLPESDVMRKLKMHFELIIKVPPYGDSVNTMSYFFCHNVKFFHLFNSYPTSKGALSGYFIKRKYLKLITKAKLFFGDDVNIIAGGGIQSIDDLNDYKSVGATFFSISTLFLHPLKLLKFYSQYKKYYYEDITQ